MDCTPSDIYAPPGGLLAQVEAVGASLVAVPPRDRRAARRELRGHDLQWVALSLGDRTLSQAASGVYLVEGRCVVLAQRVAESWAIVTTPGGTPSPVSTAPPPQPQPPQRAPTPPTQLDSSYIGFGGVFGIPSLAGGLLTVKVGPVIAEGSLGVFVIFDAFARAGLMFPTQIRVRPEDEGLSVGAMFGGEFAGVLPVLGGSGYTAVLAADWIVPDTERTSTFLRFTAGINVWTASYGYDTFERGLWVSPTIGISGGLLWQPPPPK